MTASAILEGIQDHCSPENMTPEQALQFLEDLVSDLEAMIDGLKDDLKE